MTTDPHLRLGDLVAKLARVTLKDTTRVLLALDAVQAYTPQAAQVSALVPPLPPRRPTPENIAACEQAAFALREGPLHRAEIDAALERLQQVR